MPFDTWNAPGLQDNVFGNEFSTFGSLRNHSQGIIHCVAHKTPRETESVPRATGTRTSCALTVREQENSMLEHRVEELRGEVKRTHMLQ